MVGQNPSECGYALGAECGYALGAETMDASNQVPGTALNANLNPNLNPGP